MKQRLADVLMVLILLMMAVALVTLAYLMAFYQYSRLSDLVAAVYVWSAAGIVAIWYVFTVSRKS